MLIDLDIAKQHLRIDGPDQDAIVSLYVEAAQDQAIQFMGRNVYPNAALAAEAVLAGDLTAIALNASIEAAVLLLSGTLYAQREDSVIGVSIVQMPIGAHALLQPYRVGLGV